MSGSNNSIQNWSTVIESLIKATFWIVILLLIWQLRVPLERQLTRAGIQEVEAFGVRLSFVEERLQDTISKAAEANPERWAHASAAIPSIRSRIELVGRKLPGSLVLWVDEKHPGANLYERRVLQAMGIAVDSVKSQADAKALLNRSCYDVVVSEMKVGEDLTAGHELAEWLQQKTDWGQFSRPGFVFYIFNLDRSMGTPSGAHGITNRPTDLIHYVLDVIERRLDVRCSK